MLELLGNWLAALAIFGTCVLCVVSNVVYLIRRWREMRAELGSLSHRRGPGHG